MTRSGVVFAREPLTAELWAEAMPLLVAHKQEIAHYHDIPLEPDVALYAGNEAAGILRCYTARTWATWKGRPCRVLSVSFDCATIVLADEDSYAAAAGVPADEVTLSWLVGYALFFVRSNPHYKSSVQAVQDVIYLAPGVRGGTGYKFIAWCDAQLAAEGVQAVYQHVKAAHDFGRLLERQGYELVDFIYAKRLDRPAGQPIDRPSAVEALDEAFV